MASIHLRFATALDRRYLSLLVAQNTIGSGWWYEYDGPTVFDAFSQRL